MIRCFTLTTVAAVLALTGCAKPAPTGPVADFSTGNTLVTVTHVPAPTEDGTTVFVTVDGNDAGALEKGGSLTLSIPAGSHDIGGYARSIIGRVTISPIKVTTNSETVKHVVYTVTKTKPEFIEQKSEPVKKVQEAQAPQQQAKQSSETQQTETQSAETQSAQQSSSTSGETQSAQQSSSTSAETQSAQQSSSTSAETQSAQQSSSTSAETQSAQQTSSSSAETQSAQQSESQTTETQPAQQTQTQTQTQTAAAATTPAA